VIHEGQPVLRRGPSVEDARAVCVLLHGRGRSPEDVLLLAERLGDPEVCFVAPAAADNSWWPGSFLAPFAENEPWLSSALGAVDALLHSLGVPLGRVVLGGFSQGACLASEYALRHPGRYGGLLLYTGGFCGPRGTVPPRLGSFEETPVYIGTSDPDDWVPVWRVQETSAVLSELGAVVALDVFEGMEHLVNDAEIAAGKALLSGGG
jgi:phospholipase/carboxylesterase